MTRVQFIFWLDLLLLVVLCCLEVVQLTGLTLHEWIGIGLVFGVLLHLLLAWAWIAEGTRQIFQFSASRSRRTRVNYALNFALFAMMAMVLYSGVLISEIAGPAIGLPGSADNRWITIHNFFSQWLVAPVGLHLAINWDYSVAMGRKCLGLGR